MVFPDRPLSHTLPDRILRILAYLGLGALLSASALVIIRWPDAAPVHFNAAGDPDRWGSAWEVALVPVAGCALFGLLSFLSGRPRIFNYPWTITPENAERHHLLARRMMLALRAVLAWVFVFLVLGMLRVAQGDADGLGPLFLPFILAGTLGILLWYFIAAGSVK